MLDMFDDGGERLLGRNTALLTVVKSVAVHDGASGAQGVADNHAKDGNEGGKRHLESFLKTM